MGESSGASVNLKGNEAVQWERGSRENKLGKQQQHASEVFYISKLANFLQGVISQMMSKW